MKRACERSGRDSKKLNTTSGSAPPMSVVPTKSNPVVLDTSEELEWGSGVSARLPDGAFFFIELDSETDIRNLQIDSVSYWTSKTHTREFRRHTEDSVFCLDGEGGFGLLNWNTPTFRGIPKCDAYFCCLGAVQGDYLTAGDDEGNLFLINTKTWESTKYKAHTKELWAIANLPNNHLVTGSRDKTLKVWKQVKNKLELVTTVENVFKQGVAELQSLDNGVFVAVSFSHIELEAEPATFWKLEGTRCVRKNRHVEASYQHAASTRNRFLCSRQNQIDVMDSKGTVLQKFSCGHSLPTWWRITEFYLVNNKYLVAEIDEQFKHIAWTGFNDGKKQMISTGVCLRRKKVPRLVVDLILRLF